MPCREFLSQVRQAYPEIRAKGADAVVVGTGAAWQARDLVAGGVPFPVLLDPDGAVYRALGIRRMRLWEFLRPAGVWRYVRAFLRGARPGAITGDWHQLPGVAILDPDCTPRHVHRGGTLGDYPPLADVLAQLGPP